VTIPKRGARRVEIDGEAYHWRVRRRPTAGQRSGRTPLLVAIAGASGGSTLLVRLAAAHPSNEVALRSAAVTPGHVAAYVRHARRAGWSPGRPGPTFELEPPFVGCEGPRTWPRRRRPPSADEIAALARPCAARDVFRLGPADQGGSWPGGEAYRPARIEINGVDLLALVRAVELPHAEREFADRIARGEAPRGAPGGLAGAYLAPPLTSLRWPSRELFGEPVDTAARGFVLAPDDPRRGKTLLGCACGVVECWFLLASIAVFDDVVVWHDFEQFHRPWAYDLGPFVFDRAAYARALGASDAGAAGP
jgi:hypothetical protein